MMKIVPDPRMTVHLPVNDTSCVSFYSISYGIVVEHALYLEVIKRVVADVLHRHLGGSWMKSEIARAQIETGNIRGSLRKVRT